MLTDRCPTDCLDTRRLRHRRYCLSPPCQYIDTTRKAIDCATTLPLTVFIHRNFAADFSSFIVKILQKTINLGTLSPFKKVRGGAQPWLMARWKARVEFLLNIVGLLFLSLTVEALQRKRYQDSLLSGGAGQFERRI